MLEKGRGIYTEVCFACHGDDGRGAKVPGAQNETLLGPPLAASPRVLGHQDYIIKTVLHGLTGPLDGNNYPDVMIGMGQNNDEWVAAITLLHPQLVRQSRRDRYSRRRQARAGGDGESQDSVRVGGARGVAAAADWSSIRNGS